MPRLFWTDAMAHEALAVARAVGLTQAAAELSKRWGFPVPQASVRNALHRRGLRIGLDPASYSAAPPPSSPVTPAPAAAPALPDPKAAQAQRRQASDFEALKPEDFDVGVGNVGHVEATAGAEKRQEFTVEQGQFLELLRASGGDPAAMPAPEAERSAHYIALVSEQERRYVNRRLARSTAIASAREGLSLRMLMQLARDYFWDKCTPTGYALKTPRSDYERIDVLGLSDLHFGSALSGLDNARPYGPEEESRRFAHVVQSFTDYKSKHRNYSRAAVLLNGDIVEGMLLHDMRDGAPLEEQMAAALAYLRQAIQNWSAAYPRVDVYCQPGNHGRNKLRHPGRATSSKWQSHEWWMYYALSQVCAGLPNVKFHLPFQAVCSVPLFDQWLLMTHGDTEVRLADPDTKARENAAELAKVNTTRIYGREYAVGFFGHFHKGRVYPWQPMRALFNGALIPGAAQGYARSAGYTAERCGQWIWEATAAHPVGHHWFLEVGEDEDANADLNRIIPAFRLAEAA